TARLQGDAKVLLQWSTASEQQNSYFAVERSGDGIHFQTIGTVQASASANGSSAYSLLDAAPLAGLNYYRLKQYDRNGQEQVYGVRLVKTGSAMTALALYPNPVVDGFNLALQTTPAKPLTYCIQNANGQIVQTGILTSREQWLETGRLSAGVYVLSLENGQTARFFKQ
ncbi:MAG: T9SS type A sorting domain-containing protein, partial [Bacteroidota bacterium]|nr:T9SS type A sorting domain-containing protein [Bacteroidota bacterium]